MRTSVRPRNFTGGERKENPWRDQFGTRNEDNFRLDSLSLSLSLVALTSGIEAPVLEMTLRGSFSLIMGGDPAQLRAATLPQRAHVEQDNARDFANRRLRIAKAVFKSLRGA